jgi:hypothetical protein
MSKQLLRYQGFPHKDPLLHVDKKANPFNSTDLRTPADQLIKQITQKNVDGRCYDRRKNIPISVFSIHEVRADNSIKATFESHGLNIDHSTDDLRMTQSAKRAQT